MMLLLHYVHDFSKFIDLNLKKFQIQSKDTLKFRKLQIL